MSVDIDDALERARDLLASLSEEDRENMVLNELRRKISQAPVLGKSAEQIIENLREILPGVEDDKLEEIMAMIASYVNAQVPQFLRASDDAGLALMTVGHVFMAASFWSKLKDPLRMAE